MKPLPVSTVEAEVELIPAASAASTVTSASHSEPEPAPDADKVLEENNTNGTPRIKSIHSASSLSLSAKGDISGRSRRNSIHAEISSWERFLNRCGRVFRLSKNKPWVVPRQYLLKAAHRGSAEKKFLYDLPSWHQRMFVILEHPFDCKAGRLIFIFLMCVIAVNVIVNVLMTMSPLMHHTHACSAPVCEFDASLCPDSVICAPIVNPTFDVIDRICTVIFTVEYLIRLVCCVWVPDRVVGVLGHSWDEEEDLLACLEHRPADLDPPAKPLALKVLRYACLPRNVIDVVSVLPYWITILASSNEANISYIRFLRFVRVLGRVLARPTALLSKTDALNDGVIQMLVSTVISTFDVIAFILLVGMLIAFISGVIIYELEGGVFMVTDAYPLGAFLRKGIDGTLDESPFKNALIGIYWAITTMATVGYGDLFPVTTGGRIFASCLMITGLLFLALPIAIIGSRVTVAYEEVSTRTREHKEEIKKQSLKKRVSLIGGVTVRDIDIEMRLSQSQSQKSPDDISYVNAHNLQLREQEQQQQQQQPPLFLNDVGSDGTAATAFASAAESGGGGSTAIIRAPLEADTAYELESILREMDALQTRHLDLRARIAKMVPAYPPARGSN